MSPDDSAIEEWEEQLRADDPLPTSGSASLENLLGELRALGCGPAPVPSVQLEALLAGAPGSAPTQPRTRRHRKAIAGVIVVGSVGAGLSGVAAAAADNRTPRAEPVVSSSVAPAPAVRAPAAAPGPSSLPKAVRPRPSRSLPRPVPGASRADKRGRSPLPTSPPRDDAAAAEESFDERQETAGSGTADRTRDRETGYEESGTRGDASRADESDIGNESRDPEPAHTHESRQPVRPE